MNDKVFSIEAFSPSSIAAPFGLYSHGISVTNPTRFLFTSGQLAINPSSKGDAIIPESALDQARVCFNNLRKILAEASMTPANVIRIGAYVTDREYFAEYMRARDEFVEGDPPVSTLLIVSGFTRAEFKVEVEIVAASKL